MGTFTVPIEVGPIDWQRSAALEAEVDVGLAYCSIPRDVLTSLGVADKENWWFELSDGRMMIYPTGFAAIRLAQKDIITRVVFMPEDDAPKIGHLALSSAGLAADYDNHCLTPVNLKLHWPMRPL